MHTLDSLVFSLEGTVVEVLPSTGLAYVADADARMWTLTRSTSCAEGLAFEGLQPGQQLALTIACIGRDYLVGRYAAAA